MIFFVSGPMTGYKDFNRHEFHAAAWRLRGEGHIVLDPATHPDGLPYESYMKINLAMVSVAEAILMLPGWRDSPGTLREFRAARKHGLKLYELRRSHGGTITDATDAQGDA